MRGRISQDTPVGVPAKMVWEVYRGLELSRLVGEYLADVIGKPQVLEGDGGVGTLIKLNYPPGTPGIRYMIERFTKIDHENRVKVTENVEGGFKGLGFDYYGFRLEIIEKDSESAIIRSSIEYDADDKLADVAASITTRPLEIIAEFVGEHLS
ncbi:S-norcoclaurine synthase-like [Tripterygium wilfordii]|uniref:S-norcoclaurine synthase-like n=1 Tax=Tripterygium wilfordii TaxID=458696 RepID=A0A7J7CMK1_TRIWF|nr:norbelladine synthase-like [Tripterygium wilfordii]KAF5735315.1 S-norcoclaurine synthase-like [Tripterygium wilfordii]